ncbi:MAG: TatD family hydrolase [Pseudomonadales bacterium]
MIDIGVNLLHPQFDDDREALLERAWAAGLSHIILTGTDLEGSRAGADYIADHIAASGKNAAAAGRTRRLSCTAGIHPHDAAGAPDDWRDRLEALARRPEVVAIGETGLDFHRDYSPRPLQERLFRGQLELAASLDLPVFVHDRDAGDTVADCLRTKPGGAAGVVVHCFTGDRHALHRYLDLGCHIGITGWVCDRRRGAELRDLVADIPLDRLMVETDAPFLRPHDAPKDVHGRRNEPALLPWIVRRLAERYGCDEDELATRTAANARRFFRLAD